MNTRQKINGQQDTKIVEGRIAEWKQIIFISYLYLNIELSLKFFLSFLVFLLISCEIK